MATPGSYGAFVPTTNVWEISEIYSVQIDSPQFRELLVRLYQNINNIALVLNIKDSGYYDLKEFVNSQLFFPNPVLNSLSTTKPVYRQVLRKVINFGSLPNAATKTVAHGITVSSATSFTRIYGAATDPVGFNYIPLPFASPVLVDNISLSVNATNVVVTTGANYSNFTTTYIVLEYLQT